VRLTIEETGNAKDPEYHHRISDSNENADQKLGEKVMSPNSESPLKKAFTEQIGLGKVNRFHWHPGYGVTDMVDHVLQSHVFFLKRCQTRFDIIKIGIQVIQGFYLRALHAFDPFIDWFSTFL
jgi:hypothetical protein